MGDRGVEYSTPNKEEEIANGVSLFKVRKLHDGSTRFDIEVHPGPKCDLAGAMRNLLRGSLLVPGDVCKLLVFWGGYARRFCENMRYPMVISDLEHEFTFPVNVVEMDKLGKEIEEKFGDDTDPPLVYNLIVCTHVQC
jgi:hypothetical protein